MVVPALFQTLSEKEKVLASTRAARLRGLNNEKWEVKRTAWGVAEE